MANPGFDSPLTAVLSRLHAVAQTSDDQWEAHCPCHEDSKASLSVGVVGNSVLIHCHAGCPTSRILNELGMTARDLFPPRPSRNGSAGHASHSNGKTKTPSKLVATYDYRDEAGTLLYQSCRMEPKDFRQRAPNPAQGGGWLWSVKGIRRILYRLPELRTYITAEQTAGRTPQVFIVEGEKDADRLAKLGLTATTNVGGASKSKFTGKSKWSHEYSQALAGCDVVILRDNDDVGLDHANAVGRSVKSIAARVRVPELPGLPPKGDISDYLDAGGTIDQLLQIVATTSDWEPPAVVATSTTDSPNAAASTATRYIAEADDDPHRLARVYLERHCKHAQFGCTLRNWRDEWWRWNGHSYSPLSSGDLHAEVTATIKHEFDRLYLEHVRLPGMDDKAPQVHKVTRTRVYDTINAIRGQCLWSGAILQPCWTTVTDRGTNCIGMANGILDIDRLLAGHEDVVYPHTPDWFSANCLNYDFNPTAKSKRWVSFLDRVMEHDVDRIALLQEWAGYLLLPDTSKQRFFVCEGEGANGKSVYCAAIEAMLGRQNVAHVPLEVFGQRFQLTPTLGKLANIAADVGELEKAAEGFLKSFTSGDSMQFDRKGLPPIDATPTARLMIATNNRPRFSDRSSGIWRRMLFVPFQVTITDAERIFGMDKVEWWQHSGELPGIFNWAIAGLHRLRETGKFTEPKLCKEAVDDYRLETNPARAFLSEHYCEVETCRVPAKELYSEYQKWCRESGHHPLADRAFGKEVKRCFPKADRRKYQEENARNWNYFGIGICESKF